MKTPCLAVLLLVPTAVGTYGQGAGGNPPADATSVQTKPTPYAVVEQGANHQIWQNTTYETLPSGRIVPHIHEYTELATGLNFKDENGQWAASSEEVEGFANGAMARHGQHQVVFANNANTSVAVDMQTPDLKRLQSHVLGLSYLDTTSGSNVWIAEVKDCQGVILPPNQVLYANAFTDVKADLLYTYTKDGFEQDIILRQRPPVPETFGLNSGSTWFQVFTEFVSAPSPGVRTISVPSGDGGAVADALLDFGTMRIGSGKAFALGQDQLDGIPVTKEWLTLEGRTLLVEEVAVTAISGQLNMLPLQASAAPIKNPGRRVASVKRTIPVPKLAQAVSTNKMQMAFGRMPENQGLVLDYVTLNTSLTNYTFQADSTYYFSGNVGLYGTNEIFEGGTVLKYASNVTLKVSAPVTWLGRSYSPVVMVSMNDNSVGEGISGSSGNTANYFAATALYFDAITANTNLILQNLRVGQAKTAVAINGKSGHVLSHVQLVSCGNGLALTNAEVSLRNALFDHVITNFTGSSATGRVEHLTSDTANWLNKDIGSNLYLTNCLLVAVTNKGSYTSQSIGIESSPSGVFQIVGAGSHYLASGSTNRNAGTPNINAALAIDLQKRTTYPPIVYSNITISVATTFSPQAQRDTDTPDCGYHYDPVDYFFGGVNASTNLTFTAGTAAGWFELPGNGGPGYGIALGDDATATFNGTATLPCIFARYETVQECGNGLWKDKGWLTGMAGEGNFYTVHPSHITATFTHFASAATDPSSYREYNGLLEARVTHCEFMSGNLGGYVTKTYYTNCLMDRVTFWQGAADTTPQVVCRNCTFHGGGLTFVHWEGGSPYWYSSIRDCAFDGTSIAMDYADPFYTDYDYNTYLTGANHTSPTGAHDLTVGNTFNWQVGSLGKYYLPSDSPLINRGSQTADQVGLYHFTTQTNEMREAATQVDMGYHYVAVSCHSLDTVWVDDAVPAGATATGDGGDSWTWVSSSPAPFSAAQASQSDIGTGEHQHYFYNATATMTPNVGDTLVAYVYLDPTNTPSEVMLQWNNGTWEHRACWGADSMAYGVSGTASRYYMGALPATGKWVRLEIPASLVGVEGQTLIGMAFTLYGGRATWDYAGKTAGTLCYDTDGDGIPDYLEDANGNGVINSGETDWQSAIDLGLKVLITRPKSSSVIP